MCHGSVPPHVFRWVKFVRLTWVLGALVLSSGAFAQEAPSQGSPQGGPTKGSPAQAGPNDAKATQEYVLGAEDVFTVTVLKHPEFSGDFLVPVSGIVEIPAVGALKVDGLSLQQVRAAIVEQLRKRLRVPEVSVGLRSARQQRIYVSGDVPRGGTLDLKPNWTLMEALTAAGGLTPGVQSADVTVTLSRANGGAREQFALNDVMQGVPGKNPKLAPGDVVTFSAIPLVPVYVTGKVKIPGLVRLRKGDTGLMQALTVAGGTLDDASTKNVTITHLDGRTEHVDITPALAQGSSVPMIDLAPGDLVVVPELQSRIAVLGMVTVPGFYPLPDSKVITIADAIAIAQGPNTKRAKLSKVALVRNEGGKQQRMVYDFGKFLRKGDATQNPALHAGDVLFIPETDAVEWTSILSGISSVGVLLTAVRR